VQFLKTTRRLSRIFNLVIEDSARYILSKQRLQYRQSKQRLQNRIRIVMRDREQLRKESMR